MPIALAVAVVMGLIVVGAAIGVTFFLNQRAMLVQLRSEVNQLESLVNDMLVGHANEAQIRAAFRQIIKWPEPDEFTNPRDKKRRKA